MLLENATILILDDEPAALEQSRRAMEQVVPTGRLLTATTQEQALDLIGEGLVDLLFLDVEMPGIDGFTLADYIHRLKPALKFVFLTGHTELAAESYDYEPIGFLNKPVNPARLQRTLERFRVQCEMRNDRKKTDLIALDTKSGLAFFVLSDILYISKEGRRTVIHCAGQDHQVSSTLDKLEDMFSDYGFFRLHQSVLVPLDRISMIQTSGFGNTLSALLSDGTSLPVSRRNYNRLREELAARGVRMV